MTKDESNRLASVEVKIDSLGGNILTLEKSLIDKIISLEKSLIEKITAQDKAMAITMAGQEKAVGIAMTASEKAIVKAEIASDLRSNEMNKRIDDYVESTDRNIKILTENKDINTGTKTGVTESKVDLTRYLGWIVSILSIAGMFVALFVRG